MEINEYIPYVLTVGFLLLWCLGFFFGMRSLKKTGDPNAYAKKGYRLLSDEEAQRYLKYCKDRENLEDISPEFVEEKEKLWEQMLITYNKNKPQDKKEAKKYHKELEDQTRRQIEDLQAAKVAEFSNGIPHKVYGNVIIEYATRTVKVLGKKRVENKTYVYVKDCED